MFTRQNVLRLVLAVLLLASMAVPVLGAAVESGLAAAGSPDSAVLYHFNPSSDQGVAIACQTGDPSGEGGSGC